MTEAVTNPIEQKYQESALFKKGMEALADSSPDQGEGRPDWLKTNAQKILSTAKNIWAGVKNPTTVTLAFGALVTNPYFEQQVTEQSGWLFNRITSLNYAIGSVPHIGPAILQSIQSFSTGPFGINTISMVNPNNPPLVNLGLVFDSAIGIGFKAALVGLPLYEAHKSNKRSERMALGVEPLRKNETPRVSMVGPSEFLSLVAKSALPDKNDQNSPDIIIHPDPGIPSAFGSEVEYHFDISKKPGDITNPKFMIESGISSANNLLLVAFDADHALYYGREASASVSPSMLSTLVAFLSNQPKETLAGKKILAVVPESSSFLALTTEQHELFQTFKDKGVDIEVLTPESVMVEEAKEDVESLAKNKKDGEKVQICLVGGKDTDMLKRFQKGLETLGDKVSIHIISDELLDGQMIDPSDQTREKRVEELLKLSDINYVYGDDDSQTTDLANLMIAKRGAEKGQTVCILEKPESVIDAKTFGFFNVCVYEKLASRVAERLKEIKS